MGSSEQGVNCNAFMFCQGRAFWLALWMQLHGEETECNRMGRRLSSHLSNGHVSIVFLCASGFSHVLCVF